MKNIIDEIEKQVEFIKNINKELKIKKTDNIYQISTGKLSEEELKQVKEKYDIKNYKKIRGNFKCLTIMQ